MVEKSCATLFAVADVEDYKRLLPKVIPGTCDWVLHHLAYGSWLEKKGNATLWLTGYPGSGKTMISLFIAQQLATDDPQSEVLIYFCDDKISKQKDANAILMGLISQLMHLHRSLIRHIRKAYELRGSSIVQSFSALWNIFQKMIHDLKSHRLYVIIAALDECEAVTRLHVLESIFQLAEAGSDTPGCCDVKFFLTSRPLREAHSHLESSADHRISIDGSEAEYSQNLQRYIEEKVDEFAVRRHCTLDTKKLLLHKLTSRAEHSFLWVHMVLSSLENSPLTSMGDFERILATIPSELVAMYSTFLSAIPSDHQALASNLLELLTASTRPLNLEEINVASSIRSSHNTAGDVYRNTQTSMEHMIQGIVGPLIRISDSKVSLVHQTAKEFLRDHEDGMTEASCALKMSQACMEYLLLADFSVDLYGAKTTSTTSSLYTESVASEENLEIDLWDDEENFQIDIFPEIGVPDEIVSHHIARSHSFYNYASLNWAHHFSQCESIAPRELRDAAMLLLDTSKGECRTWLQFYWADATTRLDDDPTTFNSLALAAYFNLQQTVENFLGLDTFDQSAKDQALVWASLHGHCQLVKLLLGSGADPNYRQTQLDMTALTIAAEHGHTDCVKVILSDKKTCLNTPGKRGRGALSFACLNGHENIVDLLLARSDCDPEELDHSGTTPFMWATYGAYFPLISKLSKHGNVNINHKDRDGRTALSRAASEGTGDVVKYLLRLPGIDVNSQDKTGRSALIWASGTNRVDVTRILLRSKRVNRNILDQDQRGPISWASGGGHAEVLRLLVKHCDGINDKDIDGWTPLAWAIHNDAPEVVDVLISAGSIDLQQQDLEEEREGKRTILSWAVEYGHIRVVRLLLERGSNPNAIRRGGATPISTAKAFNHQDLVDLLIEYGGIE